MFAFLKNLDSAVEVAQTERLIIRSGMKADFDQWRTLRIKSRKFLSPWEPIWPSNDLSYRSYKARLRRYQRHEREKTAASYFLFRKTDNAILGGVTFSRLQRGVAQSCIVGYWMGEEYSGQGYMSEAVEALLPVMFSKFQLHRIEAACMPANERSIRLLEKIGFQQEGYARKYLKIAGQWEDHLLYAILRDDLGIATKRAQFNLSIPQTTS